MSGHSRWSQIRHKKGTTDQKRGQVFSKLAQAIALASRHGSDPKVNLELRATIAKARALNMPKANIERAVKRGSLHA